MFYVRSDYVSTSAEKKNRSQKSEIKTPRSWKTEATTAIVSIDTDDITNIAEVDAKIMEHILKNNDGSYSCGMCGKNAGKISHIKNHVETHMEGLSFPCQSCDKTFRSRNALSLHKSKYHRF